MKAGEQPPQSAKRKVPRTVLTQKKRANAEGWRPAFLEAFKECPNVTLACEKAGVSRTTFYDNLRADEEFKAEFDAMAESAADELEQEARRRALKGWDEPVFGRVDRDQDGQIGTMRRFSDTLLIFLLKGRRRAVFGNQPETQVNIQNNVQVNNTYETRDQWRDRLAKRLNHDPSTT